MFESLTLPLLSSGGMVKVHSDQWSEKLQSGGLHRTSGKTEETHASLSKLRQTSRPKKAKH